MDWLGFATIVITIGIADSIKVFIIAINQLPMLLAGSEQEAKQEVS